MTTTSAPRTDWSTIEGLSQLARSDRPRALAELQSLFASGSVPAALDGPTEGRLVTFTVHPAVDAAVARLAGLWMPWAGKRFHAAAGAGDNLLARSAGLPARLLWPLYAPRDAGARLAAFDFTTWVEAGALDPDVEVLVIDYASVPDNPRLGIRSIRDELVTVGPGTHLGKMLWRHGDGGHSLLAYFALRSD